MPFHGTHADIGAIMFFEDYRNIQSMLKEFGLHNEQAPVPAETVLHRNGAFRIFNLRKPWTLLGSGAMSMSETVALTAQSLIAWFKNRNNALYGITDWFDSCLWNPEK